MLIALITSLDKLKKGERGTIISLNEGEQALKFMEMGCTPGEEVVVDSIAPLGDPMAIIVSGYKLVLRRSEAALINIEKSL